jgi:succinyl-diaminopimelate desuccinylase
MGFPFSGRFVEDGTPSVENLYAAFRKRAASDVCRHTDVVPVGDEDAWTHPPFAEIADGQMSAAARST